MIWANLKYKNQVDFKEDKKVGKIIYCVIINQILNYHFKVNRNNKKVYFKWFKINHKRTLLKGKYLHKIVYMNKEIMNLKISNYKLIINSLWVINNNKKKS